MTNNSFDIVVFDLGGVLIDWDPRHLYRTLFCGDHAAMERFLAEVCTPRLESATRCRPSLGRGGWGAPRVLSQISVRRRFGA